MAFGPRNLWSGLANAVNTAKVAADQTLNEGTIRIGVTGLSQAGKTVFITSLIHNLLGLGTGADTLPRITERLTENGVNRLKRIELIPPDASVLPEFDYETKLRHLVQADGQWPARTDDASQIALALTIDRSTTLGSYLGSRRLRLEIFDYPGEWLLDLPMMNQSYAAWSNKTLALLRIPPRNEIFGDFLRFIAQVKPTDREDHVIAKQGHILYREALSRARERWKLRYLQPGRFLCPGPYGDTSLLWFFPLGCPERSVAPNTLGALLAKRFDAYRNHQRDTFFAPYFMSFTRQVMLVDLLGALAGGEAAFDDTIRAIQDITRALRYPGQTPLLQDVARHVAAGARAILPGALGQRLQPAVKPLSGQTIDRVVFAATKADHVPSMQRDNLRNLLRAVIEAADNGRKSNGGLTAYHVVASLVSTRDGTKEVDGRDTEVVFGIPVGVENERAYFTGIVPSTLPRSDFWKKQYLDLPQFRPQRIDPTRIPGFPNFGLDLVLDDLIGDVLK